MHALLAHLRTSITTGCRSTWQSVDRLKPRLGFCSFPTVQNPTLSQRLTCRHVRHVPQLTAVSYPIVTLEALLNPNTQNQPEATAKDPLDPPMPKRVLFEDSLEPASPGTFQMNHQVALARIYRRK